VQRRPSVPIRAVKEERILRDRAVITHQALLVVVRDIALIALIAGEIE
jgi:hypothetical protein